MEVFQKQLGHSVSISQKPMLLWMETNAQRCLFLLFFLQINGWKLSFPVAENQNALSDIIEKCAASEISKETIMEWFDAHKIPL